MKHTTGKDRLAQIAAHTDPTTRGKQLDRLLVDLLPVLGKHAKALCRINGVNPATHFDDVHQLVLEVAWKTITGLVNNPAKIADLPSLEQRLWVSARPVVRSEMDKAKSPASGMVAAQRRRREYLRTELELFGSGTHSPTVEQVVATTNQRLRRLRKDPAREGLLVSVHDVTHTEPAAHVDSTSVKVPDVAPDHAVASDMADRILTATRAEGELIHKAAAVLVAAAAGSRQHTPAQAARDISVQLGVGLGTARQLAAKVRTCAAAALAGAGYLPSAL